MLRIRLKQLRRFPYAVTMTESPPDDAARRLNRIGRSLLSRVDEFCIEQSRLIREHATVYRNYSRVPEIDLVAAIKAQDTFILQSFGVGHPDTSPASLVGQRRALQGVPLADVMAAYRIGLEYLWEKVAEVSALM